MCLHQENSVFFPIVSKSGVASYCTVIFPTVCILIRARLMLSQGFNLLKSEKDIDVILYDEVSNKKGSLCV